MLEHENPLMAAFDKILDSATRIPDPGDYIDTEGYQVCGKCHTRKQCEIPISIGGEKVFRRPPVPCKCEQEKYEEEKRQKRFAEDMRRISELRKSSLLDERFADSNFDSFKVTDANKDILENIRRYADNFEEMYKRYQGLLLWGDVGTGKTYAAACIANSLLNRGIPVMITSMVKYMKIANEFDKEENEFLESTSRAKLLILDDLGAERESSFACEKVNLIIDHRWREKKPMIITTNLTLQQMKNPEDIRYKRVFSRVLEVCHPIRFSGKSWRQVAAADRYDAMNKFFSEGKGA